MEIERKFLLSGFPDLPELERAEVFQGYLGITPEETCTFGDNINDIEMLKSAGVSYAVANAREEVQKAAKKVCPSYEEDGVLSILKTLL